MAYPYPSSFTAVEPDAFNPPAWWTFTRDDGSTNVCAATGAAVVRHARAALGLPSVAVWDDAMQAALLAHAQQFAASQPGWDAVLADLRDGQSQRKVTRIALALALWFAYYQPNGLRLDAIGVPDTTVFPAWSVPLQEGPGGDTIVCFDPSRDPSPATLSQAQLDAAAAQSGAGLRLHAGESLPSPSPVVPPGPAGLTTTQTVLAVGGILLAAGVIYALASKQPKARR